MSERLRDFVRAMSEDLDRAKRLTADPAGELSKTDLSPEEQQIILSRDPDKIRQATGMAASESVIMNSFFEKQAPPKPARRKPRKPRKPAARKPAGKKPARKRTTKKPARPSRKTARKSARKTARKASARRRR